MSPIVHVVNVGSAETESLANVTVCLICILLNDNIQNCHSLYNRANIMESIKGK